MSRLLFIFMGESWCQAKLALGNITLFQERNLLDR